MNGYRFSHACHLVLVGVNGLKMATEISLSNGSPLESLHKSNTQVSGEESASCRPIWWSATRFPRRTLSVSVYISCPNLECT
jgi:hypothetical protein